MSRPLGQKLRASGLSDVGRKRSQNQDACTLFSSKGGALVAVVADGMGGHAGGETASRIAIETIRELLSPTHDEVDGDLLADAIDEANDRIYSKAAAEADLRGMGTTVVALLFHSDGRAWVAHAGDSRAYRLRGEAFEALTQDHSVIAELVRSGILSEEEAELDPRRNEILRSVGAGESIEVDVNEVSILPGDRFLLCSDGLTGPVADRDIATIVALHEPEDATRTLVARANEAGGPDNVTAIVLDYPDPRSTTDSQPLVDPPQTTATPYPPVAAEANPKRLVVARRLLIGVAVVGLALILSLLAIFLQGTGDLGGGDRSASNAAAPKEVNTDEVDR